MKLFLAIAAVVLLRSFLFVFRGQIHFDSDEAVFGLMAKHISEASAFPVFLYGQQYLLSISSWLAAPLFFLFGTSIAALRFPSLVLNAVVAWLFIRIARREMKLSLPAAVAGTAFLILPPVDFAATLTDVSCANIEQYFYVLLVWLFRANPIALGVVLGVGTLHREFVAFSFGGLLLTEWLSGHTLRDLARDRWRPVLVAVAIIVATKLLAPWGANHFGITTPLNPKFPLSRLWETPVWVARAHLGMVLGFWGDASAWRALSILALFPFWLRGIARGYRQRGFAFFLMATAFVSSVGYGIGAWDIYEVAYFRYNVMILLFPIGVSFLFFNVETRPAWRKGYLAAVGLWAALNAVGHLRLLADFARNAPPDSDAILIDALRAEGVTYGTAPYWTALRVSFRAAEKIRLLPESGNPRLLNYREATEKERARGVALKEEPCSGPRKIDRWCVYPLSP